MPETPTPNMALVLPTDHSETDVWGPLLESVFGLIDGHDHSAGKGARVATAGLDINADLTFASGGSYYAATNLRAVDFQPSNPSDVASLAGALFVSDADNNLYFRTTTGSNVQVTAGTVLNVAALAGGIGGDYASVSALLSFDDASDSYWLQQQVSGGNRAWARVRTGDVDIYETAALITARVRIKSPSALAASYALTLPAALPAATARLGVDSAGNVGIATARTIMLPPADWVGVAGNTATLAANTSSTQGINMVCSIPLEVGQKITAVSVRVFDVAGTTGAVSLVKATDVGSTSTVATSSASSGAGANQTLTLSGLSETVVAGATYSITFARSTGAGTAIGVGYSSVAVEG